MIRFNYNILFLLLLLPLGAVSTPTNSKTDSDGDFTKNYHKEYDVPKDATVELINKYGYTKVHAWDKRIVTIDVNIIANTSSKERAEEIFDKIDINFTTTSNYIKAETVINSTSKNWWDIKNWIGNWNNNSSYKINYDVYMPTDQFLKLTHKYGDAFVDRLERDAVVKVSYGHLRMDGLAGDLELDLAYSDGNVGNIEDGKLNLRYSDVTLSSMHDGSLNFRYSEIRLKQAGTLKAESGYGELDAEQIGSIDIHSRYDDIKIGSVGSMYVNSAYSDFDLGKLNKISTFSSTYGDIIIRDLDAEFQSLELKTSYTDVRISSRGIPYRLDASANYADIKTTGEFNSTYLVEKSNNKTVKGYTKSEHSGGMIKATLSYGGIRID
ncbi:MAG: hypothetical protein SH818_07670 [Saprospiraceae bacterium]|nr:hypothetical protein [Saprospiraceae bacterium]